METVIKKFYDYMLDYNWHTNKELNNLVWWNFKDKLLQLREKWCIIERRWSGKDFEWRLRFAPIDTKFKKNKPIQVTIVENWKAKQKFLKIDTENEFLWNTNIPNENYKKKTIFNLFWLLS